MVRVHTTEVEVSQDRRWVALAFSLAALLASAFGATSHFIVAEGDPAVWAHGLVHVVCAGAVLTGLTLIWQRLRVARLEHAAVRIDGPCVPTGQGTTSIRRITLLGGAAKCK